MKLKAPILALLIIVSILNLKAQENTFSKYAIKTGVGVGFNFGFREIGFGTVYTLGYQKNYGEKEKIRLSANLLAGGFLGIIATDTRDQYYRITSLSVNLSADALKYKAVSLFVNAGPFLNYSRGLLGTGGWHDKEKYSNYFFKLYYGIGLGAGIRVAPPKSKFAYEFKPINLQIGNNYFLANYFVFGMDFKLRK